MSNLLVVSDWTPKSRATQFRGDVVNIRSVETSKLQLTQDSEKVLNGFLHMLSHLEDLEHRMLKDLAEKGNVINMLKEDGLPAEECNFNLVPGENFVFEATGPSYTCD